MMDKEKRLNRVVSIQLVSSGPQVHTWTYEATTPGSNRWRPFLDMARFKLNDAGAVSELIVGWMPNQTPTPTTYAALTTEPTLVPLEFELSPTINMWLFSQDDEEGAFPMTDQQPYKLVMSWGAFATEPGTFVHQIAWHECVMKGPC